MLPVTYGSHCRSCHPLKFDPRFPNGEMRHGSTPHELLGELRQFYAAQAANADPELLRRFLPPRPVPGRQVDQKLPRVEEAIDQKVLAASRILLGSGQKGCAQCHELAPSSVPLVHSADISKVEVRPVNVPRLWFVRARFDHSAHRSLQCLSCHPQAPASSHSSQLLSCHPQAPASSHSSQLLLPGIEICASCHGTARSEDGRVRGGAGSHCTECHLYHNGDHPLQGNGASTRGVAARRTINELLNAGADAR
jgi:class III cytochrome C family protein